MSAADYKAVQRQGQKVAPEPAQSWEAVVTQTPKDIHTPVRTRAVNGARGRVGAEFTPAAWVPPPTKERPEEGDLCLVQLDEQGQAWVVAWKVTGAGGEGGGGGGEGKEGKEGKTGPAGPAGPTGPKGETGATGTTGPKGEAGPEGPKGTTGGSTSILDEPFSENLLSANDEADEGSSLTGLTVSGGVLGTSDANNHSFHSKTIEAGDAKHIVKINYKGNIPVFRVGVKWINSTNSLFVQWNSEALSIFTELAGSTVQRATQANTLTSGHSYWLVVRQIGNLISTELWEMDPRYARDTALRKAVLHFELTGEAATKLGTGTKGKVGLRLAGFNGAFTTTETTLDDWIVCAFQGAPGEAERTAY